MDLKKYVGRTSGPHEVEISQEKLTAFANSVGAQVVGASSLQSSSTDLPTFPTLFRDGEFILLKEMGVELRQVLHGEQDYSYKKPIRVGERVTYETRLESVHDKSGSRGCMHFILVSTEVRVGSELRCTSKTTIIYIERGSQ